jgi:hypothetical protein
MRDGAPANTIVVHGRSYVLAWVGLHAAHLVPEAAPGGPARAIAGRDEGRLNPAYDAAALSAPLWSMRTLCGRDGWFMCPGDAGRAHESPWNGQEEAVLVPTCRRCLELLDRQFAEPEADDRLAWNVARCMQELEQWGSVVIDGVPGQQMTLLRGRLRAEARRRGWKFTSSTAEDRLVAMSANSLSPERRAAVERDALERLHRPATGLPLPPPSWRLAW